MKFSFLFFLIIIVLIISCPNKLKYNPNFKIHLSYLASDELQGREAATPGDSLAQKYISEYFSVLGLYHFFDNDSYYQYLPIINKANVSNSSYLIFDINKEKVVLKRKRDFVISSNSAKGEYSGEVVFIGYGINDMIHGYDDYNKNNYTYHITFAN